MVHFIWHEVTERHCSLPLTKVGIHFGHVRMCATPYPISWIIFILDLGPSYTDELLEFRWVQIVHLSQLIYFILLRERCMLSLNHDSQADAIDAFNSTSSYLDDLLNIDNPYFEGIVNQIYPSELQLNKANISDTEAPFLDLHLSVANGFLSSKIYDKRDDFDFDIVNFPFLDGGVPRRASYGVYISQLIRFARVCNHFTDFKSRNKCLTAKLLSVLCLGFKFFVLLAPYVCFHIFS